MHNLLHLTWSEISNKHQEYPIREYIQTNMVSTITDGATPLELPFHFFLVGR